MVGKLAAVLFLVASIAACTPPDSGGSSSTTTTSSSSSTTTTTTSPSEWVTPGCYDGVDPHDGYLDLLYSGPEGVWGNVLIYPSTDGTCVGSPVWPNAILRAADIATARTICLSLLGLQLSDIIEPAQWSMISSASAYGLPPDAWICGLP